MTFPIIRPRRLRQSAKIRELFSETRLSASNLIYPLFIRPGKNIRIPIVSMPGQFQLSVDQAVREAKECYKLGIRSIILFGIPTTKDNMGSEAYGEDGIIQQAVRAIKSKVPGMIIITDLCFCEYTTHGHCGVAKSGKNPELDNDATLDLIGKTALAQAGAGADIIAPSGMIDGAVKTIRTILDTNGYKDKIIMAYSAKYASAFYGPFRDAAESPPQFGDRKTYQMDYKNVNEALREVDLDIKEGADIVMVKPALAYLDVVSAVKKRFSVPVAAYNVSGEYAMVKTAAKLGWMDEEKMIHEILTSIRRAGADLILTYHAKEIAKKLSA